MRQIDKVVSIRKISDPEPKSTPITGVDGIQLVEELRRMMTKITGDPDLPIQKWVEKRRLDGDT